MIIYCVLHLIFVYICIYSSELQNIVCIFCNFMASNVLKTVHNRSIKWFPGLSKTADYICWNLNLSFYMMLLICVAFLWVCIPPVDQIYGSNQEKSESANIFQENFWNFEKKIKIIEKFKSIEKIKSLKKCKHFKWKNQTFQMKIR